MNLRKNKKGLFLAEETLKIVIAVIAMSFLIYLLVSVYLTGSQNSKEKQAKEVLNRILEVVENANSVSEDITQLSPSGWALFSFVGDENKPNVCATENCLCVCDLTTSKKQLEKCNDNGVCEILPELKKFEPIGIVKAETSIKIKKENGGIFISKI